MAFRRPLCPVAAAHARWPPIRDRLGDSKELRQALGVGQGAGAPGLSPETLASYRSFVRRQLQAPSPVLLWLPEACETAAAASRTLLVGCDAGPYFRSYITELAVTLEDDVGHAVVRELRRLDTKGPPRCAALLPQSPKLFCVGSGPDVHVLGRDRPVVLRGSQQALVASVACSELQRGLVVAGACGLRFWDLEKAGSVAADLLGNRARPDVAVLGQSPLEASQTIEHCHGDPNSTAGAVRGVAFHPTEPSILGSVGRDGCACIWDPRRQGGAVVREQAHQGEATCLAFVESSLLLASGGADAARIWDLRCTREALFEREGRAFSLHFKGQRAVVGLDGAVALWEPTLKREQVHAHAAGPVLAAWGFRSLIASTDHEASLRLWEPT